MRVVGESSQADAESEERGRAAGDDERFDALAMAMDQALRPAMAAQVAREGSEVSEAWVSDAAKMMSSLLGVDREALERASPYAQESLRQHLSESLEASARDRGKKRSEEMAALLVSLWMRGLSRLVRSSGPIHLPLDLCPAADVRPRRSEPLRPALLERMIRGGLSPEEAATALRQFAEKAMAGRGFLLLPDGVRVERLPDGAARAVPSSLTLPAVLPAVLSRGEDQDREAGVALFAEAGDRPR